MSHTLRDPINRRQPAAMLSIEVPGAGGAPQGTTDTEMAGADVSRDATLGDAALAPGSLDAMSPGLFVQYLPGSPGPTSSPINWRRVENEAKSAFSQVAIAERLLHEALASVHHNFLRPVWVSLRKEAIFPSVFQCLPLCLLVLPVSCTYNFHPRAGQTSPHCRRR
jgi:hypothetical protein